MVYQTENIRPTKSNLSRLQGRGTRLSSIYFLASKCRVACQQITSS